MTTLKRYNGTDWEYVGLPVNPAMSPQTLGYAEVTASQTGISTMVDLTGLSVTVTVPEGRRIRVSGMAYFAVSAGSPTFASLYIYEGTTQYQLARIKGPPSAETNAIYASAVISPTAGTHTYKLRADAQAASVQMYTDSTMPAYILVEDITGSTLPYQAASVPVGALAIGTATVNQGPFGAGPTDIVGSSLNVVVPAGRLLRITGNAQFGGYSDATTAHYVRVFRDGVAIGNVSLWPRMPTTDFTSMEGSVLDSPSAGAHTYKFVVTRYANAGTVILSASAAEPAWFMVEDITPTPAPSSGAPGSTLGYAENLSLSQAVVNAGPPGTDLAGLSVTVTVPAGRRLKITGYAYVGQSVANQRSALTIAESSTSLNSALINQSEASVNESIEVIAVLSPSAGSHTYRLTANTDTGTATFGGGAGNLAFILVEDITGSIWPTGSAVTAGMVASEAWTPYTPVWINFTLGNGILEAAYQRVGRTIHFRVFVRFGSTTAITGNLTVGLPVPCGAPFAAPAQLIQNGVRERVGICRTHNTMLSATQAQINHAEAGNSGVVNGSNPHTWTLNDWLFISGTYEAAS